MENTEKKLEEKKEVVGYIEQTKQNNTISDINRNSTEKKLFETIKSKKSNRNSLSGKTTEFTFTRTSTDMKPNDYIKINVPEEMVGGLQTAHHLELLAHHELNAKIELIQYQLKQMCESGFACKDDVKKLTQEELRNTRFTRLLFLSCTTCAAIYLFLSITGVIIGVHFIPN